MYQPNISQIKNPNSAESLLAGEYVGDMNKSSKKQEQALLSISEFCEYVGIGKTKAYEILNDPRCIFSFRIGNRIYANKKKLDFQLEHYNELI